MEEIWKSIPEFEGYYEASSLGRIRSLDVIRTAPNGGEWVKKGQILKPRVINDFGHLGVKLSVNGVKCDRTVHYLVATAFHGERPEGLLIRHLDGRPSNNAPSNLAYGTQVDNMADAIAHDTVEFGERRYNAKLTNEVVIAIRIKKSEGALNKDLAAEYGLTELYIHHIVTGIANYLERQARQRGYQLLIACSEDQPDNEMRCIEHLLQRQVDAIIVSTSLPALT